ncbi:MAG: hypothetical protein ABSB76_36745 [Streptosporangiaceae bacterium]|jgi:hypothetical protein
MAGLAQVPGAAELLLAASVYREPVDASALAFQIGEPDAATEKVPAREAARAEMLRIATEAGLRGQRHIADADLPEEVRASYQAAFEVLLELPPPPFRLPGDLPQRIAACQAVGLLSIDGRDAAARYFVHRWTADALATRACRDDDPRLARAHRQAAAYWQWLRRAMPRETKVIPHDLLDARHHLLEIKAREEADEIALEVCVQLDEWGPTTKRPA